MVTTLHICCAVSFCMNLWLISVNHTSIYSVFSRCLCNLNARCTPKFLKITLIPHLLIFCRIKRKIKQGKGKRLTRKNFFFEALVRLYASLRPEGSYRRREGFTTANPKQAKEEASSSPRQRYPLTRQRGSSRRRRH